MTRPAKAKSSKREALIDTAKTLLWERGFEAMSPKAVLRASGAGQGSLYHHFEGKRDLAASALEEIKDEARADMELRIRDAKTPIDVIEAYLDAPREAMKGCKLGRLANEQTIFDPVLGPIVEDYFNFIEERLILAIDDAKAAGALSASLIPREVARTLVATVQGGYVLSRVHKDAKALSDAVRGAKSLLRALTPA